MPVTAHRESWRAGPNVIVAGSLDEENRTLVGFGLDGGPIDLSPETPPATPTLVLVPVETDFTKTLNPRTYRNRNDNGGESIGTYFVSTSCDSPAPLQECDEGSGGGGGFGWTKPSNSVQRRGMSVEEFISHMKTPNDHEPWDKGAPEFFLLLAGTYGEGQPFENRINIPEGPWSGSDDDNNSKWRNFAADTGPISLITWDEDLGTRIRVRCMEDDGGGTFTVEVSGSTTFLNDGVEVSFSSTWTVTDEDDDCGISFIDYQNTAGTKYWIPDGVDNDSNSPDPPYINGTSDLHWHGYGIQRLQ